MRKKALLDRFVAHTQSLALFPWETTVHPEQGHLQNQVPIETQVLRCEACATRHCRVVDLLLESVSVMVSLHKLLSDRRLVYGYPCRNEPICHAAAAGPKYMPRSLW